MLDPFCGTCSILVSAAALGARTIGADIDILVLKGMLRGGGGKRRKKGNVFSNFKKYGLPAPDVIRFDNSTRCVVPVCACMRACVCGCVWAVYACGTSCTHAWVAVRCIRHFPVFHSIVTDPPYGFRAGAKRLGRADGKQSQISEAQRENHVSMTKPYEPSDVCRVVRACVLAPTVTLTTVRRVITATARPAGSSGAHHPPWRAHGVCLAHLRRL